MPALDVWRGRFVERALFEGQIGVEVDLGGADMFMTEPEGDGGDVNAGLQEPHGAQVCPSVWGETGFIAKDGQVMVAVLTCRAMSFVTPSRISFRPLMPGKSGSCLCGRCSFTQAFSWARAFLSSGVMRSLRPFPWHERYAPASKCRSAAVRPINSLTRRPVTTATSNSACLVVLSMLLHPGR